MCTSKWWSLKKANLKQPRLLPHLHSLASTTAAPDSTPPPLAPHQPLHFTRQSSSMLRLLTAHPLLVAITSVILLAAPASAQTSCTSSSGCFPPIGNLAIGRPIVTNSTCMEGDFLCPLFLLTPCQFCSANSSQNLNDGNNDTFWASQVGPDVREVALRLDFERPVYFQDMAMVWMSVRPIAMTLERSCDYGETWSVYRYYALDCPFYFDLPDTHISSATPPFTSTAPICTSVQSELFSFGFTDALVTFSTSEHVPANNSQESACYSTITNLRVVFLDFFPELRLSNSSFQYYGVREWIVRGSCACNGHSATCVPSPGEETAAGKVYTGCDCGHNTDGPSCNTCSVGFNNIPYQPGTTENANACEACMCNNHATDCIYNDTLTSAVCINCTDNTVGAECQDCAPGYFQDMGLLLDDPNLCQDCRCNMGGIIDEGQCDNSGQCSCKSNVGGLKCSECRQGFFNFSASNQEGCQVCSCDPLGSEVSSQNQPLCDAITGQCQCLPTTQGDRCDQCQPGTYDFSSGCLPCACNVGGSRGQACDSFSGQCPCKPNIEGRDCSMPAVGFYAIPLDQVVLEAEVIDGVVTMVPQGEDLGPFTGSGFGIIQRDTSITFTFSPILDSLYILLLRISTVMPDSIIATVTLNTDSSSTSGLGPVTPTSGTPTSPADQTYRVAITPDMNRTYVIVDSLQLASSNMYELTVASTGRLLVDSLVVLPDIPVTSSFYRSANANLQERISSCLPLAPLTTPNDPDCDSILFTLSTEFYGDDPLAACRCNVDGSTSQACTSAGCACKTGVTGFSCDQCTSGFFNLSSNGCEACMCNETGSTSQECSDEGLCSCKPGISGPFCDACALDFFNFTVEGCSPCLCSQYTLSPPFCDVESGQCPCPNGVTGRSCDSCLPGFFSLSSDGCFPCGCDSVGSVSDICDPVGGQCPCVSGLGGRTCEMCTSGFFYTGEIGGAETCKKCVCSGRSSSCTRSSQTGQLLAVQYNFTQLCAADSVNCGQGWDIRTDAGVEPSNPTPLTVGFGYLLDGNGNPLIYVADDFFGDRRHAYGQNFTVVLVIQSTAALKDQNFVVRLGSSRSSRTLIAEPFYTIVNDLQQDERVLTLTVLLEEQIFRYTGSQLETPTLLQFLDFLTGLTEISFTADYTVDFIELNYLRLVSLPFSSGPGIEINSSRTVVIAPIYPLENCSCDDPYQGLSCDVCARGYYRPSGIIADQCMQCQCNGKTPDCDARTGVCLNCSGNTTGDSCERCLDGFYGDPTRGVPCLPCDCPVVGNGFSPTCSLNVTDGRSTCDACARGYAGRNCEICMDGFFGNPMIGRCITCECNGNVDPALGPVCDMTTGRCLNCLNNTTGFECEICRIGYYGDPGNNIACQVCPCDSRGTESYCDSLFGTCYCLPNVIGGLCNECEDGYFNITEGVGCSPCNCDSTGSTSSICNKASGDCDCYDNVGSAEDNKCSACTPSFFNLTAGVGCQACGCSALSVSQSCDQLTGTCDCQEGAIGDKCDDCAFGFTGKVPNCEACHECYFQWYNLTSDFGRRVGTANFSIESLDSFLYGNHSISSITMETTDVLNQLQMVNMTLESVTIDEMNVTNITIALSQLNMTVGTFYDRIERITIDLDEAIRMLNISSRFDGTLNMSDVIEIERRRSLLNSTIFSLSGEANNSVAQLRADQALAQELWYTINSLEMTAQNLLDEFEAEEMNATLVLQFVDRLNRTFFMLRRNLTRLDMLINNIENIVSVIVEFANNATSRLDNVNMTLINAFSDLNRRFREFLELQYLIEEYNSTVASVRSAATTSLQYIQQLQAEVVASLNGSHMLLQRLNHSHELVGNISSNFTLAISIADRINSIVLPSEDYITTLAMRITNSIIPDEVVEDIMGNASLSKEIAWEALTLAQNASEAISAAINLMMSLQNEITCTTSLQESVNDTIAAVQARINSVQTDIDQVNVLFEHLSNISDTVSTIYYSGLQRISEGEELIRNIRVNAANLSSQANASFTLIDGYWDEFRQNSLALVGAERASDALEIGANATLAEAQDLLTEALNLEANATRIRPEQIQNLAQEFLNEIQRNDWLQEQIANLTQEMRNLTDRFQTVSDRLKRCYRTP